MDKQHKETDKRLEVMEKHLEQVYQRAIDEVGKEWREYVDKQGEKVFKLYNDYSEALKGGNKDEIAKAKRLFQEKEKAFTLQDERYHRQTEKLAEELLHVNETAMAYVNHQLPEIYSLNYNGLADTVDGIGGYSFELTDPTTVKNLATRNNNLLPYKTVDGKKDIRWNTKKINSEVLQGILLGEPMDKIAKRFSNVLGMNKASAIRNARTSVTSAENKGRLDSYIQAEKDGIQLEKEWMSSNQAGRTRDWHMPSAFENLKVPIDKPFINSMGEIMYPADPHANPANVYNCRCTMVANVKGFDKIQVERAMEERVEENTAFDDIKMNRKYKTLKNYDTAIEFAEEDLKDNFKLYRGLPKEFHKPFDEYEKLIPKFEKDISKAMKKFEFSTNTNSKALEKILKDGKLKSIMETKKSNGYQDIELRKEATTRLFSAWDSIDTMKKDEFEKYGYLDSADRAKMYGNCKIVFKKDNLWDRTTFTIGDSLASMENGRGCIPSWVGDPKIVSNGTDIFLADQPYTNTTVMEAEKKRFDSIAEHGYFQGVINNQDYVELQFHGDITTEDIDYIKIPKSDKNANSILKLAKEKGIKVKFK